MTGWRGPVAGLLVLALATACFGDPAPLVEVEPVTTGTVEQTVSAPARVEAAARQDVAATVSGVVASLSVASGDEVRAGERVVVLASEDVARALREAEEAQAALASAGGVSVPATGGQVAQATRAVVADLDAEVTPQLTDARESITALADPEQQSVAEATLDLLQRSYKAVRTALLGAGDAAAAQQNAIAASVSSALNQALAATVAPQRAQVDAALAAAEAQAEALVITAPFDGAVELGAASASTGLQLPTAVPAELAGELTGSIPASEGGTLREGAPVTAGQTLFTVYDLSALYVRAEIDEVDAPLVRVGQRAAVLVDAFAGREFEGIVESVAIAGEASPTGGVAFPARIRLLDVATGPLPRPNMTASAEIVTQTVDAALAVPSRAIVRQGDATVVYVVRDGAVRIVPVEVQALGELLAAVTGEVRTGEQVVVAGYEDVSDGDRVRVE